MLPVVFERNDFQLFSYGTAILVAATLGGLLAWRLRPRHLFSLDHFLSICLITTLGAALGARGFFALERGSLDANGAIEIMRLWERSGLASIGVPLVVLPLLIAYCRWQRLPFAEIFDYLMPFTLFGAAFQRAFGCFLAGCCHGTPTRLPWGVTFPGHQAPVHPTQLYLALPLFLLFLLTVSWHPTLRGVKSLAVLGSYGAVNLAVSFFRSGPSEPALGGLTRTQLVYVALAVLCFIGYALLKLRNDSGSKLLPSFRRRKKVYPSSETCRP